jgi:hypothetical protein
MAQTNYTPISLYYSATASNVPTAANLVPGELAINTADGKLYYEDSAGVVQVLATKSTGSIGGSNTQVQFNNSGSLGGSSGLTWDGSFLTTSSIKNSALTSGRVTYAGASGLLSDSANLNFTGSFLNIGGSTVTDNHLLNIQGSSVSNNIGLTLNKTNGTPKIFGLAISGANALSVFDYSASTTRFVIDTNGLVGIGTSSPAKKLEVASSDTAEGIRLNSTGVGGEGLSVEWITGIGYVTADIESDASGTGGNFAIRVADTSAALQTRLLIDNAGNVGIGTTSPGAILHTSISGSGEVGRFATTTDNTPYISIYSNGSMRARLRASSAETGLLSQGALPLIFGTNDTERMRIDSVGIVTMNAYGAGAATFSAAGVISSVSDETWKTKDGVPTNTDAMLQKLEPGYWFYNEEKAPIFGADRQLGFYAQNVREAIGEEAAPTPEEGKPWGYYDRSVLAVAVMSLKNALNTIEELKQRITALENK